MDKKKIISELKTLFSAKEEKFMDSKSGDYILRVMADDFATELHLWIVTPEGIVPAEDRDYTLEDGRVITARYGTISMISKPETKTEEPATTETPATPELPVEQKEEMAEVPTEAPTPESADAQAPAEAGITMDDIAKKIDEMIVIIKDLDTRITALEGGQADFSEKTEKIEKYSEKLEEFTKNTPANLEKIDFKSVKESVNETKQTIRERNLMELKNIRSKK